MPFSTATSSIFRIIVEDTDVDVDLKLVHATTQEVVAEATRSSGHEEGLLAHLPSGTYALTFTYLDYACAAHRRK
jgi:hypothetical protein